MMSLTSVLLLAVLVTATVAAQGKACGSDDQSRCMKYEKLCVALLDSGPTCVKPVAEEDDPVHKACGSLGQLYNGKDNELQTDGCVCPGGVYGKAREECKNPCEGAISGECQKNGALCVALQSGAVCVKLEAQGDSVHQQLCGDFGQFYRGQDVEGRSVASGCVCAAGVHGEAKKRMGTRWVAVPGKDTGCKNPCDGYEGCKDGEEACLARRSAEATCVKFESGSPATERYCGHGLFYRKQVVGGLRVPTGCVCPGGVYGEAGAQCK